MSITRNEVNGLLREAFTQRNHYEDLLWNPDLCNEDKAKFEKSLEFYRGKIMGLQHVLSAIEEG